jgi:hypothetical protein
MLNSNNSGLHICGADGVRCGNMASGRVRSRTPEGSEILGSKSFHKFCYSVVIEILVEHAFGVFG